jgi:DNA repair exonuclease SbcCD ATPase subunit
MLNKITLTNFRRHRDLSVTFGAGMTAIRALNEQGKSTLLEAISYALFGVKAIRDALEDCVTWGEAVGSLKVELEVVIDSVVYTIKRGKSGAEINYDGGIVTGQNECTAFISRLLKVDAGAAARLTLSNQNEIRGALESGAKETTALIEKLAEFDQIDRLIELMQEKLTLGNTGSAELTLKAAQELLERAKADAVPFDADAAAARIDSAKLSLQSVVLDVDRFTADEQKAQEAHAEARERVVQRDNAIRNAARTAGAVLALREKISNLGTRVAPDNVAGQVEALQRQIADAGNGIAIAAAFAKVGPYTAARVADSATYEGTLEALDTEIGALDTLVTVTQARAARLDGDIRLLKQTLTHGSCTFCGKDFSGVPEVAAKNAETQTALDAATADRAEQQTCIATVQQDLVAMRAIRNASTGALKVLDQHPDYCELADGELPPVLRWKGPVVGAVVDTAALKRQIEALQASQRAYDADVVRLEGLQAQLLVAQEEDSNAQDALLTLPEVTLQDAQDTLTAARGAAERARAAHTAAVTALSDAERFLKDQQASYDRAVAAVADCTEALAQRERDLETLEFNNALLKRVRQCKPLIADKLWNIVLTAVSSYFSDIRGTASKVTKESDGFKVDGHSVTSMSGSTLDALGLSIRVALVRTFLPAAPFLILDEPAAAMDHDRTDNMLGFLAQCSFQQILLVTHEEVSQSVADHLIQL